MKPRVSYRGGLWYCVDARKAGWGPTPEAAFLCWDLHCREAARRGAFGAITRARQTAQAVAKPAGTA